MAEIHNYQNEQTTFGDDDFYDIDCYNGTGYETKKIKGSTIKQGIASGLIVVNSVNSATGALTITGSGGTVVSTNGTTITISSNVNQEEIKKSLFDGLATNTFYSDSIFKFIWDPKAGSWQVEFNGSGSELDTWACIISTDEDGNTTNATVQTFVIGGLVDVYRAIPKNSYRLTWTLTHANNTEAPMYQVDTYYKTNANYLTSAIVRKITN